MMLISYAAAFGSVAIFFYDLQTQALLIADVISNFGYSYLIIFVSGYSTADDTKI